MHARRTAALRHSVGGEQVEDLRPLAHVAVRVAVVGRDDAHAAHGLLHRRVGLLAVPAVAPLGRLRGGGRRAGSCCEWGVATGEGGMEEAERATSTDAEGEAEEEEGEVEGGG